MGTRKWIKKPHHSEPCEHPTKDGEPCPNLGKYVHIKYGMVCRLHAYHDSRNEDRNVKVTSKVSASEMNTLKTIAAMYGMSVSSVIRNSILGIKMPEQPTPLVTLQIQQDLSRIGTNLNQVTRRINTLYKSGETPGSVAEVLGRFREEFGTLETLIRELKSDLATRGQAS